MLRKIILVVTLFITAFSLLGCQTIQGFGRDMSWLGGQLSGETDDTME